MGRRAVRVDEPERWVFNRLAAAYRSRPPYPIELLARLRELAGAGRGARVVDLGAGIGHLAVPLAERGAYVAAVEPAQAMLSELRARVPPTVLPLVELVHAAAESTGLPARSFDLVVVADALHWIDPERGGAEAARLLRPGGRVAVVEASFAATPFMTGLAALLAGANPKARRRPPGALRQFLVLAAGGAARASAVRIEQFADAHALDDHALEQLLLSMSHVGPALGPERLEAVVEEARQLGRACGGARFARALTLSWVEARGTTA